MTPSSLWHLIVKFLLCCASSRCWTPTLPSIEPTCTLQNPDNISNIKPTISIKITIETNESSKWLINLCLACGVSSCSSIGFTLVADRRKYRLLPEAQASCRTTIWAQLEYEYHLLKLISWIWRRALWFRRRGDILLCGPLVILFLGKKYIK